MIEELNRLLADHEVLYHKLRGYHWSVRGPFFFTLHEEFEKLYRAAADHADALAERIVALGGQPVAAMRGQLEQTRLEEDATSPPARTMVRRVVADLETLTGALRSAAAAACQAEDPATANLLEGIADEHEKTRWMLAAWAAEES